MNTYRLTREDATEIANDAKKISTYSITDFVGYYTVFESMYQGGFDVAVTVSKCKDDDGSEYFCIWTSYSLDEPENDYYDHWEYTETLDENELVEKLVEIANGI